MTTPPPPTPEGSGGQPDQQQGAQPAPGQYQGQPPQGQYGQPAPGQYQGQPPQGQYGQPAPGQYQGQPPQGQYGQPAPGQYQGQPAGHPPQAEGGGLDPKVGGLLAYITWIGGLIILLTQKDRTVRFHGAQSIVFSIALFVILFGIFIIDFMLIFTIGISLSWILNPIVGLGALALWIVLVIKAYNYEYFKLPLLGNLAEKFVK